MSEKATRRMMGVPLAQAAKRIGKHRSTLSKWLKQGAPCVEEGHDGRGHSAIVDVDALMRWKAGKLAPGLAQRHDEDILKLMETALMDALKRDELQHRTKTTAAQAALAVLIIFERVYRNIKQQPLEARDVPAQMRNLCTDYLDSVERGRFQRRSL
jgi:phage terminase Nu1 subunit (DNA packaging protein)